MVETLAIMGGEPVIPRPLPPYRSLGRREVELVTQVVRSGCLSGFYGSWGEHFFGGPLVRRLEEQWARRFGVAHAVAVNSATSGLYAAMGAIGIGPGDEVIVPPTTMSATVMAPLVYGGVPVFADIEDQTFGLDPEAVRAAITPRTRAILTVNLFGHPSRLDELMAIAREHHLYLVEDNAQAPLAQDQGRYAGTIGHIGVFSLNYHKHIHTGEGGMCVTNDERLAQRLALIRNHGENVVETLGIDDLTNLVGFNYRLTELQAAVGLAQLEEIDRHVARREAVAQALSRAAAELPGIVPPVVRRGCRHVYYVWAARYQEEVVGVSRELFSRALAAEGFPHFVGYVKPLYHLPLFQRRIAMGKHGFPFRLGSYSYPPGLCPVAERLHRREFLCFECCPHAVDRQLAARLGQALRKVHAHAAELRRWAQEHLEDEP